MAINVFASPVSVALLTIPKGLLVTIINGGILKGHQRASHSIFVTFGISTLILCLSTPEIRNYLSGEKSTDSSYLPSSSLKSNKNGERLEQKTPEPRSGAYISGRGTRRLALASFTPIAYWFISHIASSPIDLNSRIQSLQYYTHSPTVDIVISYYDEELDKVHDTIQNLRYYPWIKNQDPRFIIYTKAAEENTTMSDEEFLDRTGADKVYHLRNRGRESGTYLRHILRNYNITGDPSLVQSYRPAGLADYTLFMQPVSTSYTHPRYARLALTSKHYFTYLIPSCMNGNSTWHGIG